MKKIYAIYDDDKFLFVGTIVECANYLEVSVKTAHYYHKPAYHKRNKNGIKIYKIEIEEDL